MFGLGFSELLVILAVALIFIGPDKLPELAQKLGRFIWQVKHTSEELRREIALPEFQKEFEAQKKQLKKEISMLSEEKEDSSLSTTEKAVKEIEENEPSDKSSQN